MEQDFLKNTSMICYTKSNYEKKTFSALSEIDIHQNKDDMVWLNTYGIYFNDVYKKIILQNELDEFLLKLLSDSEHPNKVINLENSFFITLKILKTENRYLEDEQMIFVVSSEFIWSIQEKHGDYFGWIRERLESNKGLVRKKKSDYLLFLLMESIIDNYLETYQKNAELSSELLNTSDINPTPEFTSLVGKRKQELFNFKKAAISLRDTIVKLENVEVKGFNSNYFIDLREQTNNLISNIDFELQELESKINMIFSIQGHRLNEVMKTLTIFSVVFIPLTFMAGIYGMNFENMPELKFKYGYFILMGLMVGVTLFSIWYFKRKKWF